MTRAWLGLWGLLTALLIAAPAAAQQEQMTIQRIRPAITTQEQCIGPSSGTEVCVTTAGRLNQKIAQTDGYVFVPALKACRADSTNFVATRVAANDWALARTETASNVVYRFTCSLDSWLQRVGTTRGIKITALRLYHQITTTALSAATPGSVATKRYANNTANDVGPNLVNTWTMPTATQTQPYLTAITLTTARFLPANTNTEVNLEYAIEMGTNGVYRLYGVGVAFDRLD